MRSTEPNRFYFYNDDLNDKPLNQYFNEEAGIQEVPFTSSLFLPYLVNADMIGICDANGWSILENTDPKSNFTMFDRFCIDNENKITSKELVTLPHSVLWDKAKKILSGLKMVSDVEEEQGNSDKPEYSEERNYQNSIFAISEDVLKQVGKDELFLMITYDIENYNPFGVATYFIYLPLVWRPTPLKRHGKTYYYPTVKVKPIVEPDLITKWPTIDSTIGKKTTLEEALEKGDVKAIVKNLHFTIDNFPSDVLEAVIDQCQAYPMFNFDMMVPNTQYMPFVYGTMFESRVNPEGLKSIEDNPDAKPGYVFKFHHDQDNHTHLYLVRLNKATLTKLKDHPDFELHDLGIINA